MENGRSLVLLLSFFFFLLLKDTWPKSRHVVVFLLWGSQTRFSFSTIDVTIRRLVDYCGIRKISLLTMLFVLDDDEVIVIVVIVR